MFRELGSRLHQQVLIFWYVLREVAQYQDAANGITFQKRNCILSLKGLFKRYINCEGTAEPAVVFIKSYRFVVLFPWVTQGSNEWSHPTLLSGKGQKSIFPIAYFPGCISFCAGRNSNMYKNGYGETHLTPLFLTLQLSNFIVNYNSYYLLDDETGKKLS